MDLLFSMSFQFIICFLIVYGEGKFEIIEIEMENEVFRVFGVSIIEIEYFCLKNVFQSLEDEFF